MTPRTIGAHDVLVRRTPHSSSPCYGQCHVAVQQAVGRWADGYLLVSEADMATALRAMDVEGISPYAAEPILMERAAAAIFAALGAAQEKGEAG